MTNSPRAWLLATRPKTLAGAVVPVAMAIALTHSGGSPIQWTPALLCLCFAILMQIDSNLVNDYFDFQKGVDNVSRRGPKRACAEGWITLPAMRIAIGICTVAACAIGLPLILWGGWPMIAVGVACVVGCFLYTILLSRIALGDVLVVAFFGVVPVCVTYWLQTHSLLAAVVCGSLACGFVIDLMLVANNWRDRENDIAAGKLTLVGILPRRMARPLYISLGIAALALSIPSLGSGTLLLAPWLLFHLHAAKSISTFDADGQQAIRLFALSAKGIPLFGLSFCAGALLSNFL